MFAMPAIVPRALPDRRVALGSKCDIASARIHWLRTDAGPKMRGLARGYSSTFYTETEWELQRNR